MLWCSVQTPDADNAAGPSELVVQGLLSSGGTGFRNLVATDVLTLKEVRTQLLSVISLFSSWLGGRTVGDVAISPFETEKLPYGKPMLTFSIMPMSS